MDRQAIVDLLAAAGLAHATVEPNVSGHTIKIGVVQMMISHKEEHAEQSVAAFKKYMGWLCASALKPPENKPLDPDGVHAISQPLSEEARRQLTKNNFKEPGSM